MKRFFLTLLAAALAVGCTNVTPNIGTINGVTLGRVTTRGFFSPSTTTIVGYTTNAPGLVQPLANATGPGVLPAIANAGGTAGAAALIRPARTSVNNTSGDAGDVTVTTGGVNNTTGGHVHNNTHNH